MCGKFLDDRAPQILLKKSAFFPALRIRNTAIIQFFLLFTIGTNNLQHTQLYIEIVTML